MCDEGHMTHTGRRRLHRVTRKGVVRGKTKESRSKITRKMVAVEQRNTTLVRQIQSWRRAQAVYMPLLDLDLEEPDPDRYVVRACDEELQLPSQLTSEERGRACVAGLVDKERQLRD